MNKAIIGVLAAAILCSCQMKTPVHRQQKERLPVKVKVMTVGRTRTVSRNTYMGEAVTEREATLTAPFPGSLQSLNAGKGSVVRKGEVLATLSSQQVESAYSIAKADLDQARDAMERVCKVYESGGITQVQMMDIQTKLDKAEATMSSAEKAVADCSVKAPYNGVVSEIYPSVGEDLTLGAKILKITDISDLKINISVHENEIASIKTGMSALVDIPALGLEKAKAKVCEKSVLSSSLAHSYICALKLESSPRGLMPGMAAKVRFESTDGESHIVIPASAVQIDMYGKYVWIADTSGVEKRHIGTSGYSGKGVIISEGLAEGDRVIVEGYQKVSSGMKVREVE